MGGAPHKWDAMEASKATLVEGPPRKMEEGHKIEETEADDVYLWKWICRGPTEENINDGLEMEVRRLDKSYAFFFFFFFVFIFVFMALEKPCGYFLFDFF